MRPGALCWASWARIPVPKPHCRHFTLCRASPLVSFCTMAVLSPSHLHLCASAPAVLLLGLTWPEHYLSQATGSLDLICPLLHSEPPVMSQTGDDFSVLLLALAIFFLELQ